MSVWYDNQENQITAFMSLIPQTDLKQILKQENTVTLQVSKDWKTC